VIHDFVSQYRIHGTNLIFRHHEDPRYYAANLDYFLEPRRLAIARGALTPRQLRAFDRMARRSMRRTLEAVGEHHPAHLRGLVRHLWSAEPGLTLRVLVQPRLHARLAWQALRRRLGGRSR
jgi:hypothetical protein